MFALRLQCRALLAVLLLTACCQDTGSSTAPPGLLRVPLATTLAPGARPLECAPLLELFEEDAQQSVAIAVDGRGTTYLAYDVRGPTASGIYLATEAPGAWWVERVAALPNGWVEDVQVDARGRAHVLYTDLSGPRVLHAWRGPQRGWRASEVGPGHGAALAVDAEGRAHVVHRAPGLAGARYSWQEREGWRSEPVDALALATHVALGLDGSGGVHLAYVASRSTQLFHAVRRHRGAWTRRLVATREGSATFHGVDLALDASGAPTLATTSSDGLLWLAEPERGTWRLAPVLSGVDPLHRVSLALDAGGHRHVGFMRADYSAGYATDRGGRWRQVPLLASSFAPAALALTPSSQPVLGVLSASRRVVGLARPCSAPVPRLALPRGPPHSPQGRAAP